MKKAYPIFVAEHMGGYLVFVPDFEIYTEEKSLVDAMEMARDAIGYQAMSFQDDGKELPEALNYDEAVVAAKANNDIFDYSQGIITMVDIDFSEYKKKHDNRMVKENCTIPYYLNEAAEKEGINFSRLLQEALQEKLGLF